MARPAVPVAMARPVAPVAPVVMARQVVPVVPALPVAMARPVVPVVPVVTARQVDRLVTGLPAIRRPLVMVPPERPTAAPAMVLRAARSRPSSKRRRKPG